MAEPTDTPDSANNPPKKADKATIAQRIEEVLRIRLDGAEFHDIVQYASEKQWGVSERQLWNYIHKADDLLVERQERNRKRTVARHVAQRQALFARCVNGADFRTALAVLTDLAKLRGLYPEKEAKELAKIAVAQGMKIEELERRLRDAARTTPTQVQEAGSPAGSTGSSTPGNGGSSGDVASGPGPIDG